MLGASAAAAEAAVKMHHPDREHPLAAEAVAERRAGEQQHRERERVGVDRPLEAARGRAEVVADDREGHRDDEVVERDHEEADRRDDERPEGSRASRIMLFLLPGLAT